MTDRPDWLESGHEAATIADEVSRMLFKLAYAFEITGNDKIANKLDELAVACAESAKLSRESMSGVVYQMSKDTEQSTRNMIGAVLATLTIAQPI